MGKIKPIGCWEMSEKDFLNTANPMVIMIFINQIHRKKMERLLEGTGLHRAQHRMLMTLSEGKLNPRPNWRLFSKYPRRQWRFP